MSDLMNQNKDTNCSCTMVIFGISGDLAKRKLLPALFHLEKLKLLPDVFKIIGFSRKGKNQKQFCLECKTTIKQFMTNRPVDEKTWERFRQRLYYQEGRVNDPESLKNLKEFLIHLNGRRSIMHPVFYFALPPSVIESALEAMKSISFTSLFEGQSRAMVEKPFGRDIESARQLNRLLSDLFGENHIYRIDHYLAKDTVKNLMVFRFTNAIFEPIWNRNYIDNIQITAAEEIGIEGRTGYYEETGVVRDMLQNHVMQILSLTTMEPPLAEHTESIRDKKVEVYQSILPILKEEFVLGQYQGYNQEPGIDPKSATPTFVALKILINNWRWHGVPFYIRTGKRLAKKVSEVIVQFKNVPLCVLGSEEICQNVQSNVLIIRIQPDEGIQLSFTTRVPGFKDDVTQAHLNFRYADLGTAPSGGYEQVLLDGIQGKPSLFWRTDGIEASWRIVDPLLKVSEKDLTKLFPNYESGSWGPAGSDRLLQKDGRNWLSSY